MPEPAQLREAFRSFATTVALITTRGPNGPNVMAAEWTYLVSHEPFLILVVVEGSNATHTLIRETREFGVNLASEEQVTAMSFAGHFTKRETDKLSSELFEPIPANRIRAPLLAGSVLRAECRLVREIPLGAHTGFLGEVLEVAVDPGKRPIILHRGPHRLGSRIERPESLAIAVTPAATSGGTKVSVEGELTSSERAGRPVRLRLLDLGGTAVREGTASTDRRGMFTWETVAPPQPGRYVVEAQHGSASGRASLDVT